MYIIDAPNDTPVRYATFTDRLFAGLIDTLILAPVCAIFFIFSFGFIGPVVVTWLYFALLESGDRQATFGKRVMGIIVTDMDGEQISILQGAGRYLLRYASVLLFMIGIILMFFTEKRQALHDLLTQTLVVKAS
ncbi:MAG: RDD family protein [Bacteroidetes bacterium]|nr:MAG: RDD family protein [Bacteroidota bacterium]